MQRNFPAGMDSDLKGIELTGKLLPLLLFGLGAVVIYVMAPRAPGASNAP